MSDILCLCFSVSAALDAGEERETDSDLMLAQMLQMQFDKEFDTQLRTEEKKFNGDSKRNPMDKSCIKTIQGLSLYQYRDTLSYRGNETKHEMVLICWVKQS